MSFYQTLKNKNNSSLQRIIYLLCAAVSSGAIISLLFTPFCLYFSKNTNSYDTKLSPLHVITIINQPGAMKNGNVFVGFAIFIMWALYMAFLAFRAFRLVTYAVKSTDRLGKAAKSLCTSNTLITGIYFVGGIIYSFANVAAGGYSAVANNVAPLIAASSVSLLLTVYTALFSEDELPKEKEKSTKSKQLFRIRIEMLIYTALLFVCTLAAFFSKIVSVKFSDISIYPGGPSLSSMNFSLDGMFILKNHSELNESGQLLAFLLVLLLTVASAFFVSALVAAISRSRTFFSLSLGSVIVSSVGCFAIGMYGIYYQIMQKNSLALTVSVLTSTLEDIFSGIDFDYFEQLLADNYSVKSQSFIWFLVSLVGIALILIRRTYSKGSLLEKELATPNTIDRAEIKIGRAAAAGTASGAGAYGGGAAVSADMFAGDPCPAFSEIDSLAEGANAALENKKEQAFENPTLSEIVKFIVEYARNSENHLIYKEESIAVFIAGLGAAKLTILQGMSGTGKTSLPKIFTEALMSECNIVEVESSWRDKNELLGYYNEFSKTYTPKKFTQALYNARLHPETLTFIVLDEMNLSRIEYYFSDFLSLMENDPDKREIKLLNVSLYKNVDGEKVPYYGLTNGHTVKIPSNIWFIGTANRDESTFEISDKVYDRAHTMNFNERAEIPVYYDNPIAQRFLSADAFNILIENAIKERPFRIASYPLIREIESLLKPYNISFGNRIAKQIERFVSVYSACFPNSNSEKVIHDAVESIMLSKVVCKLELKSIEDKAELAERFEALELKKCSKFILGLDED